MKVRTRKAVASALSRRPGTGLTVNAARRPAKRKRLLDYDPSRTGRLRLALAGTLKRKFARLASAVRAWAMENVPEPEAVENATWVMNAKPEAPFLLFLRQQYNAPGIQLKDEKLWDKFIRDSFLKGGGRAFDDVKNKAGGNPSKTQFMKDTFGAPEAKEKVKYLAGRSYEFLDNVTKDMSDRMSKVLVTGLAEGKAPADIADDLVGEVGIGESRALMIARTEIITAHAEGQLQSMKNLGVDKLGVAVEWSTTGDDKVCAACEDLGELVVDINQASGMLPRHPNCRCAWVPSFDEPDPEEVAAKIASSQAGFGGSGWPGDLLSGEFAENVRRQPPTEPVLNFSQWVARLNLNHFFEECERDAGGHCVGGGSPVEVGDRVKANGKEGTLHKVMPDGTHIIKLERAGRKPLFFGAKADEVKGVYQKGGQKAAPTKQDQKEDLPEVKGKSLEKLPEEDRRAVAEAYKAAESVECPVGEARECHASTAAVEEAIGKKAGFKAHYFDEEKAGDLEGSISVKDAKAAGVTHPKALELIEKIKTGEANGHSFAEYKGVFIDPHLSSQGVPQDDIDATGRYFSQVYKKIGIAWNSFFATCDRDEGGHCLPGEGSGAGGSGRIDVPEVPHFYTPDPKQKEANIKAGKELKALAEKGDKAGLEAHPGTPSPKVQEYKKTLLQAVDKAQKAGGQNAPPVVPKVDAPKPTPTIPPPAPAKPVEPTKVPAKGPPVPTVKLATTHDAVVKGTGLPEKEVTKAVSFRADPFKGKGNADTRNQVAGYIHANNLEVKDAAASLLGHVHSQAEAKAAVEAIGTGNVPQAVTEFRDTPVYDLQCLSKIEVHSTPVQGEAVCYMGERRIVMGKGTRTGSYRHELGHAIHAMWMQTPNSPLAKAAGEEWKKVQQKLAENPIPKGAKLSHEEYETKYGVVDIRSLDNEKENVAEHYRLYHRELYRDRYEGGNGKYLAQYRERHPGWAKIWDAHYTAALLAEDKG